MRDMLGRADAISVAEALSRLVENLPAREPGVETVPLEEACCRVLASDILSPEDLPLFSRSTVDGFSVISADTFGATEGMPAYVRVTREILMGEEAAFRLGRGEAAKIATGGMLPEGADAVVMLEDVQQVDGELIEVLKPVAPGENVIKAGEDIHLGELVLGRGHVLRPQDVSALAALGITKVPVCRRPRVSIISTGDEIIPVQETLRPGRVRDSNSYNLFGLVLENGAIPVRKGIFRDMPDLIRGVIAEALRDSDLVLITGGSSVGSRDHTASVINSLGEPGVLFHGIALKPGKPTIGALVGGVPVFGLPGHPAAVAVCFSLLVLPVIRHLLGVEMRPYLAEKRLRARLAKNVSSAVGREEHIRVAIEERDCELWAVPVLGKSGLIRTLVKADGTIVLPAQARGLAEGETVEVILF